MDHLQYSEAIRRDGAALATAAGHAGVDGRVPSCPEWTVADLLGHVGRIHRWVTAIVEQRPGATEHHWSESEPPAVEKRIEWFSQGLDPLADALAAADPATEVWSWTDDHSVGFWARRQANETAVHRWDAELAADLTSFVKGRKLDDDLSLNRAIRPISGASLTGRAIVNASRKILAIHNAIK